MANGVKGRGGRGRLEGVASSAPLPLARSSRHPVTASARRCEGGWTLIELIVTVTILTILSVGIIPVMKNTIRRQREHELREALREMREAIEEFHRDTVGIQCAGQATAVAPVAPVAPVDPNNRGGGGGAYIDPRSKVVISDCTIFGVDNPDHYPPTLETLVEGVSVIPRANLSAATLGSVDTTKGQATDNKLVSTKKKIYLSRIPTDPITGKAEWDLRSSYDEADSSSWGGQNVFDVRSKAQGEALNGEKYSDW